MNLKIVIKSLILIRIPIEMRIWVLRIIIEKLKEKISVIHLTKKVGESGIF